MSVLFFIALFKEIYLNLFKQHVMGYNICAGFSLFFFFFFHESSAEIIEFWEDQRLIMVSLLDVKITKSLPNSHLNRIGVKWPPISVPSCVVGSSEVKFSGELYFAFVCLDLTSSYVHHPPIAPPPAHSQHVQNFKRQDQNTGDYG